MVMIALASTVAFVSSFALEIKCVKLFSDCYRRFQVWALCVCGGGSKGR